MTSFADDLVAQFPELAMKNKDVLVQCRLPGHLNDQMVRLVGLLKANGLKMDNSKFIRIALEKYLDKIEVEIAEDLERSASKVE